ncbi:hypothetical protein LSCM1_03845 [Leishmania martiniquensis]|uniref:Leucine-rich repeat protein n=1 Tax=Leishmania martiniquensis TaxID=1580590 RepID=A0A836KFT2_9TRYP|nr:hypothetical protein LSCM1_03845 [Leishmania martiniquensis]
MTASAKMNDDACYKTNSEGGAVTAAVSPTLQLTPEEETALLAEYGAEGPYDDIVEWVAPSRFKSEMGDGHVFLTGTMDDNNDDDDSARDGDIAKGSGCNEVSTISRCGRTLAHKDPLRLYLHEHFPSLMLLGKTAPSSLMETVNDTLDALEGLRRSNGPQGEERERHTAMPPPTAIDRSPTFERHAAVLRRGKEWARRASLAAQGASIMAVASRLLLPEAHAAPAVQRGDGSPVKVAGVTAGIEDTEYSGLIESMQQLLAKADETVSARSAQAVVGEATDTEDAVRELREREALLTEDALDEYYDRVEVLNGDSEEEEVVQLLRRAREGRARLREALTLSTGEAPASGTRAPHHEPLLVSPAEDVGADAQVVCLLFPKLPHLYAFEMALPVSLSETAQSITVDDCAVSHAPEEHPVAPSPPLPELDMSVPLVSPPNGDEKSLSLPQLLMRNTEMLTRIANTELRDAEVQRAAVVSREECVRGRRVVSAARERLAQTKMLGEDRSALGLATLPSFVQQLDVLLSPTQEEQYYRRGVAHKSSIEAESQVGLARRISAPQHEQRGGSGGAAESESLGRSSLEQIRWKATRDSFLLDREACERRRMRFEDELVEREMRAGEEQLALYAEQRSELEQAALQAVESLGDAQHAAFAELFTSANKDRALARQSEELRRLQEVEKLVYTLIIEWEVQREQLLQEEALSLGLLRRDANEEEQLAQIVTQRRRDDEVAAARRAVEQLRSAFEQQRLWSGSWTHKGRGEAVVADPGVPFNERALRESEWYCWRIAPLRTERAALLRWSTAHRKVLENVRALLAEAEGRYRAHAQAAPQSPNSIDTSVGLRVLPQNLLLVEGGALPTAHGGVLDADALVRLLWPSLHAVLRHPKRAHHYLAKLDLSLGDVQRVNWDQLRHLRLRGAAAAETQREPDEVLFIAPLVKELDFSGNPIRLLDVLEAVRTFSSLQRLSASHAQLHSLDTSDTIDMTSKAPETGLPDQCRASTARVASARSSHLRHVTAARNHALAAQVHLLFVDVSSNALASLTPLSAMASSSLVHCLAKANNLTTLDSLSGCVELRELSAAHNRLTDVQAASGLPLLRELDVESNNLTWLTAGRSGGDDEVMSDALMLLSRLNASHNPLCGLPTSQHVYPCLTHLFVNHAKLTSLAASSLGWFPMLTELQAEGNEISDISGVQHCPRLQYLKLSHNRLDSLSALQPLRCCTRLQVLDLTGNPCLATASHNAQFAAATARALYDLVPSLEVLNISPRAHACAQRQVLESCAPAISATAPEAEVDADLDHEERPDAALAALATPSGRYLCATPQLYREVFSALCWDAQLQQLLEEKQLRETGARRPWPCCESGELPAAAQTAAVGEESDGHQPPNNDCAGSLSDLDRVVAAQIHARTVNHQCRVEHYRVDAAVVSEWISLSEHSLPAALALPADGEPLANMHVRNLSYEQQRQDHVGCLARAYIAEWLLSCVLVRRARLELHRLRLARGESEGRRQERAARRIQPVWRGAALRSRLRRILHPMQADDDAETAIEHFIKVDVDHWLDESASVLAPVEELFHGVVKSARGIAAVPFGFSATTSAVGAFTTTGAPSVAVSVTSALAPPGDARPHTGASAASQSSADNPPNDIGEVGKGMGDRSTLVEQWGPRVAAQLRRKQQKSTRAHQQYMRKEFLQDPLRVKRELREDHAQQRRK